MDYLDEERDELIIRLMQIYPYPRSWFQTRTTAQLIRMYNTPASKVRRTQPFDRRVPDWHPKEGTRKYDEVSGQWLIYTDGHGWEPESN